MHTAPLVQDKGNRMSLLDERQSYLKSDQFTHREKIALRYCDAIMHNPLDADDAMWAELHKEFTEPELVELGHYIGFISGGQRWLLTLHTQRGELAAFMAKRDAEKKKAGASKYKEPAKELAPVGK
jgi:alkylhydroperoxidase family enzyme